MDLLAEIGGDVSECVLATCATLQTSEQRGGELGGHKLMSGWSETGHKIILTSSKVWTWPFPSLAALTFTVPCQTTSPTGRAVVSSSTTPYHPRGPRSHHIANTFDRIIGDDCDSVTVVLPHSILAMCQNLKTWQQFETTSKSQA